MQHIISLLSGVVLTTVAFAAQTTPVHITHENSPILHQEPTVAQLLGDIKDARLRGIMTDLLRCESGFNPNAVNPKDLDGTASLGLAQFKPSTLYTQGKRFGVLTDIEESEVMNIIFDPAIQIAVASKMVEEGWQSQRFWMSQFPGCAKIYRFWER